MPTLEERVQTLEDKAAIHDLVAVFADAATRHDMATMATIWKKDGTFTIGAPMLNVRKGVDEITGFITKLRGDKEFFVQFVNSGTITLAGNHATAQWIVEEAAKGGEMYYHNYCIVSDRMEKVEGAWLFAERYFHFAYLDFSPFTGNAHILPNPLPSI